MNTAPIGSSGTSGYAKPVPSSQSADIIWDLSMQLGEARNKIRMLEWKLEEMKKILE